MKPTQVDRLLIFLANNPGASSLDVTIATRIVNVTGRVSDARDRGHVIECRKRSDGVDGYWIMPKRSVDKGEQTAMAL